MYMYMYIFIYIYVSMRQPYIYVSMYRYMYTHTHTHTHTHTYGQGLQRLGGACTPRVSLAPVLARLECLWHPPRRTTRGPPAMLTYADVC